jgi:hypothetical protein
MKNLVNHVYGSWTTVAALVHGGPRTVAMAVARTSTRYTALRAHGTRCSVIRTKRCPGGSHQRQQSTVGWWWWPSDEEQRWRLGHGGAKLGWEVSAVRHEGGLDAFYRPEEGD